jgi:hypothetical protein
MQSRKRPSTVAAGWHERCKTDGGGAGSVPAPKE